MLGICMVCKIFLARTVAVVQLPSHVWLFATPWTAACQASLSLHHLLKFPKFMSMALVMPSSHLIWCPLLLLPSIFLSIRDFSNELVVCTRWPKYWISSFNISLSNEYLGLISLKIYWFDLLAAQGTFQGSSPAPQFKGIDSLVLCLL